VLISFVSGGGAGVSWTLYPPLSVGYPFNSIDIVILRLHLAGVRSILGALNFIVTIINLRSNSINLEQMGLFT